MGLISKVTLLGAGYVLGARAGKDRYFQIVDVAQRIAAHPEVQAYLDGTRPARAEPRPSLLQAVVRRAARGGRDALP